MIILYFLWINILLVLITSGFSTTAIVVYILSSVFMIMRSLSIIFSTELAKKNNDFYVFLSELKDDNPKLTKSNIVCSNIIHLVLIFVFLHSYIALGFILFNVIIRLIESYKMEKLFNG